MNIRVENLNLPNPPLNEHRRILMSIISSSHLKINVSHRNTLRWERIRQVLVSFLLFFITVYLTYYGYGTGYHEGFKKARAEDKGLETSNPSPILFNPRLELLLSNFLLIIASVVYYDLYFRGENGDKSRQRDPDVSLIFKPNSCILLDIDYEIPQRSPRFPRLHNFMNTANTNEICIRSKDCNIFIT